VSRWTGIPIAALDLEETEKLIHLADRLHERVVGQNEAVNLVVQAVLRSRAGLYPPGQPIGSFLFLGSTGVGKTELAKALAEQLFDDEKMLLRFDMSEYVSPGSALRLIGAPPRFIPYHIFLTLQYRVIANDPMLKFTDMISCFLNLTVITATKMVDN
jgi:ATP-dependent Clp protease ATP-binding subunit ClpA